MDQDLIREICETFRKKESWELRSIYRRQNFDEWSAEAFEAAKIILKERNEEIPDLKSKYRKNYYWDESTKSNAKPKKLTLPQINEREKLLIDEYKKLLFPILQKHLGSGSFKTLTSIKDKNGLDKDLNKDYVEFWNKILTQMDGQKLKELYQDLKIVCEMIEDRIKEKKSKGLFAAGLGFIVSLFGALALLFIGKIDRIFTELLRINLIIPNPWKIFILIIIVVSGTYSVKLTYLDEKYNLDIDKSLLKSFNENLSDIRNKLI